MHLLYSPRISLNNVSSPHLFVDETVGQLLVSIIILDNYKGTEQKQRMSVPNTTRSVSMSVEVGNSLEAYVA